MSRILLDGENQITNPYSNSHPAVDVVKKWYQQDTVIAHSAGEVVMVQTGQRHNPGSTGNASYGNFVKIKHDDGYYTLYAHLKEVYVKKGDRVNKAARLGYMGDTGNAYGVHLHFEIRNQSDVRIDPDADFQPSVVISLQHSGGIGKYAAVPGEITPLEFPHPEAVKMEYGKRNLAVLHALDKGADGVLIVAGGKGG